MQDKQIAITAPAIDVFYKVVLLIIAVGGIIVAITLFPFDKFVTKERAESYDQRFDRQKGYIDAQDALLREQISLEREARLRFESDMKTAIGTIGTDVKIILRDMPRR